MAIEKIKIMGAVLELPAKQHCQFGPFTKKSGKMGWIGSAVYLAGSHKTAPRYFIFSTAMGPEYSYNVKSIATNAPPKGGPLFPHLFVWSPW